MGAILFKIATREQWRLAERQGEFLGAPVDLEDGFIQFSLAHQVRVTAARHFACATVLLLVRVDGWVLGGSLRYEPSRGGQHFPHHYAALPLSAVISVEPLPLGRQGLHIFPDDVDAEAPGLR